MRMLYERCAGLDVHQKTVGACVRVAGDWGGVRQEVRTFGTTLAALTALRTWLAEQAVTQVAMESTGVYWKPVYNVLEGEGCTLLVVNAQHYRRVPGRKTDVQDAVWLADLLQHGLLRGSFIPDREQRQWRDLTRHRATLIQDRARVKQRIQKTLEDANLKLGQVLSDVLGVSGRAMLAALVAGETDPDRLAALADGRVKADHARLATALTGQVQPHHRFLLGELLRQLASLEAAVARVSAEVARQLAAHDPVIERLDSIPGINRAAAEVILAEVGVDGAAFPSAGQLASWAGLCPGNKESGGRRLSGKTRPGNGWLRRVLFQAAHAAVKQHGSFLAAFYRRLKPRLGAKKALVAVAHRLLVIVYHVLTRQEPYHEHGDPAADPRFARRREVRLVSRLEGLGYTVTKSAVPAVG